MTRTRIFALATILVFNAVPALAGGTEVEVDRSRLDDPAYVEALYGEIEAAAYRECRRAYSSVLGGYFIEDCIEDAIARAVEDAAAPELTAFADTPEELRVAAQ